MEYNFYTYILANPNGVLYIGMTNNLIRRISEHKELKIDGFTKKYNCTKLRVFGKYKIRLQCYCSRKRTQVMEPKEKRRTHKIINPTWRDLYGELLS